MSKSVFAGFGYFVSVFAFGFLLGAIRVSLLVPKVGETAAVIIELPIILTISWPICGWIVRRTGLNATLSARLAMGITAFSLLLVAEVCLALIGFGQSMREVLEGWRSADRLIGLAGQIVYACFPLFVERRPRENQTGSNVRF